MRLDVAWVRDGDLADIAVCVLGTRLTEDSHLLVSRLWLVALDANVLRGPRIIRCWLAKLRVDQDGRPIDPRVKHFSVVRKPIALEVECNRKSVVSVGLLLELFLLEDIDCIFCVGDEAATVRSLGNITRVVNCRLRIR